MTLQLVSAEAAASRRYSIDLPNGVRNHVTSYMGVTSAEARARGIVASGSTPIPAGPVAYLVEQPPGTTLAGHYHQVDQFQVFVAGEGAFGSSHLAGIHVHYAAAFTPYAPISAHATAIHYFTMRPGFDPGPRWMPESKRELLAEKRAFRARLGTIDLERGFDAPGAAPEPVFAADDDGVGAWVYRLAPNATVSAPSPALGGGQFVLVLRGICRIAGLHANRHAIAHVGPAESPSSLTAAVTGAVVLLLQFSRAAHPTP